MSDRYTEYERTGYFGNLGNSFSNIIIGVVLFLGSFVLHTWNEGRAVDRYKTLESGKNNLIQTEKYDPANKGKLVYTAGKVQYKSPAFDKEYNVTHESAVQLVRKVEMYQWKETKRTDTKKNYDSSKTKETTYTYDKIWSESYNNSDKFNTRYRLTHTNPPMKVSSKSFFASPVNLKGYKLKDSQIRNLSAKKSVPLPADLKIPENIAPKAQKSAGYIFISRSGSSSFTVPDIGDYRISFEYMPLNEISVIGEQDDGGLKPYATDTGNLFEIREGKISSDTIFKKAAEENSTMTWILRGVGLLFMTIGLALIASPLEALADIIPFLGSVVGAVSGFFAFIIAVLLSAVTIAVAWFAHRPMLSIALIGGGLALWFLFRMIQPSREVRTGR